MQIVQSYWSRNQKDLLLSNSGWAAPEYNLMGWALSCLQLKKSHNNLTLYADTVSAKLLIDQLQLPYTNVVCNLDKLNNYHPDLWALPKIYTYAEQENPFLHVDGDVFIWEKFDDTLLSSKLIAQNKESATAYYENIMRSLEKELIYFPDEIKDERQKLNTIEAYNAGIFGGNDILFFKEFTCKALKFVEENIPRLNHIKVSDFNIFFEQYLFYCLAKKQDKKVSLLFDQVYEDYGYSGFGNFCEVPYERNYIHLLGTFKRNRQVCADMANHLRKDYPEYYYRIIQLCYEHKIKLEHNFYGHLPSKTERDLLNRYHFLNRQPLSTFIAADTIKTNKTVNRLQQIIIDFLDDDEQLPETSSHKSLKKEAVKFEKRIEQLCNSSFNTISLDYLYQRDISHVKYIEQIFGNKDQRKGRALARGEFEIISSKYDWSILDKDELPLEIRFRKILSSEDTELHFAVVPECNEQGYSIANIDELDRYILQLLSKPLTIGKLLEKVASQFEAEELKSNYTDFELLIYGRIKMCLLGKLVKLITF